MKHFTSAQHAQDDLRRAGGTVRTVITAQLKTSAAGNAPRASIRAALKAGSEELVAPRAQNAAHYITGRSPAAGSKQRKYTSGGAESEHSLKMLYKYMCQVHSGKIHYTL